MCNCVTVTVGVGVGHRRSKLKDGTGIGGQGILPTRSLTLFFFLLVLTLAHTTKTPENKSSSSLNDVQKIIEKQHGWWDFRPSNFLSRFSQKTGSRSKRTPDDDFFDNWDNESDQFSFDNKDAEDDKSTTSTTTTTSTTSSPTEETSDGAARSRTVRETDDEDLVASGDGEGSGGRPRPHKPGYRRRFYRVTMTIGKTWTTTLTTNTSSTFRSYESELEKTITEHTTLDPTSVRVVEFSKSSEQNSVRCKFDMGIESDTMTRQEIEEEFEQAFEVGRIGQMKVSREAFSIKDIGAPREQTCFEEELTCRNGDCVSLSFRCDGKRDCRDGSDEDGCPPGPVPTPTPATTPTPTKPPVVVPPVGGCRADDQTTCQDGVTIICSEQICDGKKDCPDGEDEKKDCEIPEDPCPYGQFQCDLNKCKKNETWCDGVQDCADGFDESNCPYRKGHCETGEWGCRSGECIEIRRRCDGIVDCRNGSDEARCQCLPFEWECATGECIPRDLVCDGHVDCLLDKSDEIHCISCKESEFECGTGLCIPKTQRCDKVNNCQDKSDELNCPKPTCRDTEFRCHDGTCIPASQRCNRREECPDASDEDGCPPSCGVDQFTCSDGTCLGIERRCNFVKDCRGGEDEIGCVTPPERGCTGDQFTCKDGSCIEKELSCDGYEDCPDGSDELSTSCSGCASWQIRCGDGTCIPAVLRCNGRFDCIDGNDEKNCTQCTAAEFRCENGGCVDRARVCDYIPDCSDGTDEQDCHGVCGLDDVLCGDGKCVGQAKKCDGVFDCVDGTDERGCGRPQPVCPRSSDFRCGDGTCIDELLRCNGKPHCSDQSDELNCQRCRDSFQCLDGKCIETHLKCDGRRDCIDGSDELDCAPPKPKCFSDEFPCGDGDCVAGWLRCDGRIDCYNGADEVNCPSGPRCRVGEFQCGDGRCLDDFQRCDGQPHCSDLSDERDCDACRSNAFRCTNGNCIDARLKCNGRFECSDGSDERECVERCPADEFQCGNGQCLEKFYQCNGNEECPDGSDELNCAVCKNSFRCLTGKCIKSASHCNGRVECPDGSDERGCATTCAPDQFSCENGQCISASYKCDNYTDCADQSDEDPAVCGGGASTCRDTEFRCQTGLCVPRGAICNGRFECPDGSDEFPHNCPACRPDQFRCSNGICLPASKRCDRRPDCGPGDGSDEHNCPTHSCLPGQFSCRSRDQCVAQSAVCNGHYECNDFSDEDDCDTSGPPEGLKLRTYPTDQTIKQVVEGNEVVFQCRDEGPRRAPVKWSRGNGLPLPPGSRDFSGRLEMPHIAVEHTGTYICEAVGIPASTQGQKVSVYLRVDPYEAPPTRPPTACGLHEATCGNGDCIAKSMVCDGDQDCADGSDELRCRGGACEPNEFQCSNKRCVLKTWRCDGDDDCGDGTDESGCSPPPPGSPCRYNEFQCSTGQQCIPKAFHCDKENDCADRSDEFGCSPPTIEIPPPPLVTIDVGDVFNISCRARGIPPPEVIWRLNWGHVPEKCQSRSTAGTGLLTCPSIQVHEQGAYSCEAINNLGSTFAIPDCTLVVRPPGTVCSAGFFNDEAISPRDCLSCFCFGHTSHCSSVSLYSSPLPAADAGLRLVGVDPSTGEINERTIPGAILKPVSPSGVHAQSFNVRDVIPYFALPTSYNGNQLRSYGGQLRYTIKTRGSGLTAPDVILKGNGRTLTHTGRPVASDQEVSIPFTTGTWVRQGAGPASREEILLVLSKVEHLLLRAQYDRGSVLDTTITNILMDSASTRNAGTGQASLVEECRCPPGYTGLSCEECAPGYQRRAEGPWLGVCVRGPVVDPCPPGTYNEFSQCRPCPCPGPGKRFGTSCYKDTDGAITCACNPGHTGRNCADCAPGFEPSPTFPHDCRPAGTRCDQAGSVQPTADPSTGRCVCKDLTTGPLCTECKANSFHLSSRNQYGCTNCFCMGITNQCSSSNWYRIQETAGFHGSSHGFTLTDEFQRETITTGITSDSRQLSYKGFAQLPTRIYYWQLPPNFLGDKVTSYGGHLNYTVRYVPPPGGQTSPNNAAEVELNGNDIRLLYYRKVTIPSNRDEVVSVPLLEQYWQRKDGQTANREHLLMALANLDSLLIKATYTTTTRESFLSDVILDYAVGRNTGQERAYSVEQCVCPQGYVGLSCQECAFGYTRSLRGLYLGLCEPCACNGQSDECDARTGVCKNCRGHTTGDFCESCEDGYIGDPRSGSCRPDTGTGISCNCDPRGAARPDCPDGRNCICKGNAEGPRCNLCRPGTFALQAVNPLGCLQCFCSGVSTECASANLYRLSIDMQLYSGAHEFSLTDRFRTSAILDIIARQSEDELSYTYPRASSSDSLYWSLPPKFTGNRAGSYGGFLKVTRRYTVYGTVTAPQEDIDVILVGKNGVSLFSTFPGAILPGQSVRSEVRLRESAGWRHETARMASREDLMGVLVDLEAILIRATFADNMETTHLKDVALDDAVRQVTPFGVVVEVEECRCPAGYEGNSCESCSANYYRDPSSRSSGGSCVQCPCGLNAEGCRFEAGRPICLCRPGYSGPSCETRDHLIVELRPVTVNLNGSPSGRVETFECSYQSRANYRIDFTTNPAWVYSDHAHRSHPLPPPPWSRTLTARIPLTPQLRSVICRISNSDGETVAQVYSSINSGGGGGGGGQPPISSEVQVTIAEPTSQVVQVGAPVSFRCSARSLAGNQLRLTWSKEGGVIPAGRARDDGRGLLVVSDVRPLDTGTYICTATDGSNTNSMRAVLIVGGGGATIPETKPELTITPTFLTVQSGESAQFRCVATGYPPATVTWTGGRAGSLPPHVRVDGGLLTIPICRKSDEAEYFCQAENRAGVTSLRTILYVRGDEEETRPEPPFGFVVTISPTQAEVRPGETVRFRCESTDRRAQVQWAKLSGTLPINSDQTLGTLTINSVREGDAGMYACTATGASGQSTQAQARLTVSYVGGPPEAQVAPERQTVPQGSQLEIRCSGSGSPTFQWSKVQGTIPPTVDTTAEVLTIKNVQVSDRGVYVCTLETSAGKSLASAIVEVERREPPRIEIYPGALQTVLKDASALFQCRIVAGIPAPTVTWSRVDGQLLPSTVEELQGGAIRFNRVTGDEKGQYICNAENLAGSTSATAVLEIQIPPRVEITPPSPLRVKTGEHVKMECRAFGDPLPSVSWTKLHPGQLGGVPLSSVTDLVRQVAVFEIDRVTKADEGSYSCVGLNTAGSEEGRVQLIVDDNEIEREPQPSRPREREHVYRFPINSQAEIRCFQSFEGGLFDQLYLDWERTDGGSMPRDYHVRDGILYIQDVRPEDAGRYSCTGTNQQGQIVLSVDAVLELIGGAPPRLELQPTRQVVRRGDDVNINCIATGDQPITITWFKANLQQLPPSVFVNGPQITFRGIEVTDAGRYACRGTNAAGSAEAVAEVIVNSPLASLRVREQTGFVGSKVELRCSGGSGGRITWRKDGGQLPITAIPLGPTLTLLNLKLSDAGRYSCEGEAGGPAEYIELSVEVGSSSGGRSGPCSPEEFRCESGERCVPADQRCDGEFDCVDASDEIGCWNTRHTRHTRGATESVRVHITADKDLLQVGEDVEVRCDVSGDRSPIIRWTKVRGALGENVQTFGNLLRVTDVTHENGGVYRCVAITKSGVFEDDYALTIQANPDIPLNSENIETKTAPLGTTVMMDCRTDLEPPIVYTWSKQNGQISTAAHSQGALLTIPDLSPEDAGTYVCTANNYEASVDIPTVLVVNGVVPYFTQNPTSYMILPTLSESYLTFDIQISFKPEDKNGLLLYNGQKRDGSGDFISFGLSNGHPEFRFDVGSGPAVIRADQPISIGKWHTVNLTRDKSGGSMKVDDQGPYLGNVRGKFQGLDLIEPLHIGGVPNFNQIHRLTGHTKGFVGCVSELILGGKSQHLLRDAQTSRGISTCDTCVVNSCRNGGVCQEGLTSRGYTCICQAGYAGDDCEVSGQACFLGACGTGKCINILGGYECYCPFGKTGVHCERDSVIFDTPSFSGDSFMSYPTPKALKRFKMALRVRPETTTDGILMYASQTEGGNGDYTSLAVKDGHLEFQYDMGSGPALIRSKRTLKPGEWVDISVERDAQEGELKVGGDEVTTGKSPGQTRGLNLNTQLYLGGYDRHRIQLNSNVKVHRGFKGCVSGLTVSGMDLNILTSVLEGANVENCEEDSCTKSPCQNGGSCHVIDTTKFKCSCLRGFHGDRCEEGMNFTESVAFRGEGYLELPNDLLPHIHMAEEEVIELEITTKKQHGLILWHAQSPTELDPDDYLAIGLSDGRVEFSWNLGSGEAKTLSNLRVDDGEKHLIVVKRQGSDGSVQVDEDVQQFARSPGITQTLNTRGNIYLGGCPDPRAMTHGKYSDGFVGCVHALRIQDKRNIDLNQHAISAVNLGPCLSETSRSNVTTTRRPHNNNNYYDYEDENDEFDHVGRNRVN